MSADLKCMKPVVGDERGEAESGSQQVTLSAMLGLYALALALRAGVGIVLHWRSGSLASLQFPDEEQYWLIASSFWNGHGLRDELGFGAGRMPLYPILLAPFTSLSNGVAWAKAVHWALAALAAPLTALLAARFLGRKWALGAGIVVALDPFLVYSAGLLLTEPLFTAALLMMCIAVADVQARQSTGEVRYSAWMMSGVLAALCIYTRESSAGLVLLMCGFLVVAGRMRASFLGASVTVAIVALLLLPWALRNQALTGRMFWLTSRGGISLYDGVHDGATGASDLGDIKNMPDVRGLSESQWDQYFRHEAWESIREDPGRIVRLAVVKLARMWNPVPNVATHQSAGVRLIAAAWTVPLFASALAGIFCWHRWGAGRIGLIFLLLPIIYFTLLHSVFVGSVRYRLPLIPLIAILAAHGASVIMRQLAGAPKKGTTG